MMVAGFLNFALAIAAMAFYKTGRAEKKTETRARTYNMEKVN